MDIEDEDNVNDALDEVRSAVAAYMIMVADDLPEDMARRLNRNIAVALACALGEFIGKSVPSREARSDILVALFDISHSQADIMASECFGPPSSSEVN